MKLLYFSILFFTILEADIFDVSIPENDTASYNYADFRIWINDSTDTLKGVYWFMHPNNGDSRNIVDDSIYQSLAVGQNFALMGAHIFNMHMSSGIGDAVIAAMDSFAVLSQHSEMSYIPFFINGYSWGGQFGYHFTKWIPERVIGFITQKGGYHDTTNAGEAIEVPALMFIGENDLPYRIENLTEIFLDHRLLGAKWALAMEQGAGHSLVTDTPFLHSYFNTITDLRLPTDVNVFVPITLNTISDTISWLGNQENWTIGSWECYNGDYFVSSWLPSKNVAEYWQSFISDSTVFDTSECDMNFDSSFVFFKIGIHGLNEQSDYIITTNDMDLISDCRSQLELPEEDRLLHINGNLDYGDQGFNQPWSWHIIPNQWSLAEMSIGVCNGQPEEIENNLDYWIDTVGQFCNWGSFIKDEIGLGCDSEEVLLWDSCYSIDQTTELDLSSNNLTGEIPLEIGELINLNYINLRFNQLSGQIPSTIGSLSNLHILSLSDNQLSGQIPEQFSNLLNIQELYLYNNQLSGEIPDIFTNLNQLSELGIFNNNLEGTIPSSLCEIYSQLNYLGIYSNNLCPPYPDCLTLDDIGNQDTTNCLEVFIKEELIIPKLKLHDAYPNPFNPITTINYDIPHKGLVNIKIFDSIGREILTLYDGYQDLGNHTLNWNATKVSNGVYFIVLQMGNKKKLKKVILLK